ncbi:MAG: thiamine pyrophosphate-dependent dehydrogenase E1 component subunit alpha [Bdellovibrionales bacterium]|nr:thiamine pyrophosphate-dependent dehydrogenase E1 component subunit alpha [Bdellovibrionales bacterium]
MAAKSSKKSAKTASSKSSLSLPKDLMLRIYDLMVRSRILEERMIQVYRRGDAFFWIGAPGEEAFGVALGLLANKGQGPEYDYMHLHYRCTPTLLAMGMSEEDALRLIMNRATDVSTGGRNFSNHYCYPQWNVLPVSSPIEIQYSIAIGTAISQKRHGKGVSIITGGDAGTAEGDFASALIWSSRPASPLPMYMTVQNNRWGISTDFASQHGEKYVADRGKAFGIRTGVYNGNDPVEAYLAIKNDLDYIRKTGKPVLSEFMVSRLYGHSSASGANRSANEPCCIELFEKKLIDAKVITAAECKKNREEHFERIREITDRVREEPQPTAETLWEHTYKNSENADWRKF